MWSFLLSIWQSGVATEPAGRLLDPAPPAFRGAPVLVAAGCERCGDCVCACPTSAIALTSGERAAPATWTLNLGQCVFCGLCAEACPTGALTQSQQYALAALHPSTLMVSVSVGGTGGQHE